MKSRLIRVALCALAVTTSNVVAAQTVYLSVPSLTVIDGERRNFLAVENLAKLPRREMRISFDGSGDSATVSGIALWDVLQSVRIPSADASGRQRAVLYIRLEGLDGQNAVVALAEIDPGFSKRPALLMDRRNGKPLDASEGTWRLVLPDDMNHARWIGQLKIIEIGMVRPSQP